MYMNLHPPECPHCLREVGAPYVQYGEYYFHPCCYENWQNEYEAIIGEDATKTIKRIIADLTTPSTN